MVDWTVIGWSVVFGIVLAGSIISHAWYKERRRRKAIRQIMINDLDK